MAKKSAPKNTTKQQAKGKERTLFSVRSQSLKPSKKSEKRKRPEQQYDDSGDEQFVEVKKVISQAAKIKERLKKAKIQEKICYDSMASGTVIGCCVSRVFTDRIIVSLPHRLKGYVPLTHVSQHYTDLMHQLASGQSTSEEAHTLPDLYRPGQFITVAVAISTAKTAGHLGLPLSLFPSDVNGSTVSVANLRAGSVLQCAIISSEDHGYLVDTGVRGVRTAFLPQEHVPTDVVMGVGSVLQCVVLSATGDSSALILTVSAQPGAVSAAANTPQDHKTGALVPGATLYAIVIKAGADGLTLHLGSEESYLDALSGEEGADVALNTGIVSRSHLRGPFDQGHLFRAGQKLQPKVLFVTNFPRVVHLTLNKNVLNYNLSSDYDPQHGLKVGDVLEEASVLATSPLGLSLRLSDKCLGFTFISKVPGAKKFTLLEKKFPAGKLVRCRLIAFNAMDQLFLVSLDVSGVTEQVDVPSELKVGMVLPVTIVSHEESGARVRTKTGIDGFVRKHHLTDTNMTDPHLRHPVDKVCKGKVIEISERKSGKGWTVYFTLKSLLIESDLPLVTSYSEGNAGVETLGVVRTVATSHMFIDFCGGTYGVLNANKSSTISNFHDTYEPGHVLQVRIKSLGTDPKPLYFLALPSETRKRREAPLDIKTQLAKIEKNNIKNNVWLRKLKTVLKPKTGHH